jgi:pilin isopeptide linkage protein
MKVASFENQYMTNKALVQLNAMKILQGRPLEKDEFSFVLKDSSNAVIQTATNTESGLIQFDPIEFNSAGTYNYTITETQGLDDEVIYDPQTINVTITITSLASGIMQSEVLYNNSSAIPTFTNKLKPSTIGINKTGINLNESNQNTEFFAKIKLYNENGMPLSDNNTYSWYTSE